MEALDQLISLFSDFANPKKRIFVGYLGLSLLIAFGWLLVIKRQNLRDALRHLFDKRVFFSKSSIADYKIFVINGLISVLIAPYLLTQIAVATALFFALHKQSLFASGVWDDTSKPIVIALFSLCMFVVDDLTKYLLHRWMHRWPLLWAIHKVHHSAETLTPITVYRVHPLEGLVYGLRGALAQGVVMSTFIFLFGDTVDLYTIVGVNVLVFLFHVTGSNLRHSHISIQYWPWLEHIFISPAQHQLHHSIAEEHFDKNFGAALAVWDWLFGSLHISEDNRKLTFGLGPKEMSSFKLADIYWRPFSDMGKYFKRRAKRIKARLATSAAKSSQPRP